MNSNIEVSRRHMNNRSMNLEGMGQNRRGLAASVSGIFNSNNLSSNYLFF